MKPMQIELYRPDGTGVYISAVDLMRGTGFSYSQYEAMVFAIDAAGVIDYSGEEQHRVSSFTALQDIYNIICERYRQQGLVER